MMNPSDRFSSRPLRAAALAAVALGAGLALTACKKEEPEPEPVVRNTAPPKPTWGVEDLQMHQLVQFPEKYLPKSKELAQSMADLASGFAGGARSMLEDVLSPEDQQVLELMLGPEIWDASTRRITAVRICNFQDQGETSRIGIGIEQQDAGAFMLAWTAQQDGDAWRFSSFGIEIPTAEAVAMLDDSAMAPPAFDTGYAPPKIEKKEEEDRNARRSRGRGVQVTPDEPTESPDGIPDPFRKPDEAPPR